MNASHSSTDACREGQEGSAYIVALLVLFVLSVVGLSLSLVTQTEMMIGSQERTIQRVFFAAENGINVSSALALFGGSYERRTVQVSESVTIQGSEVLDVTDRVDVTPFVPIQLANCNLCQVNSGDVYGSKEFRKINHLVNSEAVRVGEPRAGGEEVPLGRKLISSMIQFEPWEPVGSPLIEDDVTGSLKY